MSKPVSRRGVLLGSGALAAGAVLSQQQLAAADRPHPPSSGGMIMGIGTHFSAQHKGYEPTQLRMLRQAGATSIRDEIEWDHVETQKDVLSISPRQDSYVRAAHAAGMDVMLILDYSNPLYDNFDRPRSDEAIAAFTRYAVFLARHFRGIVNKIEIWNEWDIAIGGGGITTGGSPEDYMRLVRSVYPALKTVDRRITVIAGAMTNAGMFNGFLDGNLAGGLLDNCDVVSLHPYNWGDIPFSERRPERWIPTRIERVQNKLREHNGGKDFPVYVTEMSWPTQLDNRGIAPDWAAAYMARSYLLSATLSYVKGYWWHNLQDNAFSDIRSSDNFGLVRADDTPKPAFHTYAGLSALLNGGRYEERLATPDPEIWALRFRAPREGHGGPDAIALWNSYMDDDWSVVLKDTRRGGRGELVIEELGTPARRWRWGRREWYTNREAPVIPDELELTLRRMPVVLYGDLDDVTITRVTKRPFLEPHRP